LKNPLLSAGVPFSCSSFLIGLTVALKSQLAAIILIVTAVSFHLRVLKDEQRLTELFGQPYVEYKERAHAGYRGFSDSVMARGSQQRSR
jgi:hypothetical protein